MTNQYPPGGPAAYPPGQQPGQQPPPASKKRGCGGCLLGGLIAIVVLAGGVVGFNWLYHNVIHPDRLEGKGTPVAAPKPHKRVPPPAKPSNEFLDPQPVQQIAYDLQNRVLKMTGVPERTSGDCDAGDFTGQQAATFDCTITYGGRKVVYTVDAQPSGGTLFKWTARAKRGLLARDGVLAEVWKIYHAQTTSLRCDPLPELAEVPVNTPIPQRCYAKFKESSTFDRTAVVEIKIRDSDIASSIDLETKEQE